MDCPKCKEPMIILELNQVEIDSCFACGGIWLDRGELEMLIGNSLSSSQLLSSMELLGKSHEKELKCPVCHKKMLKVLVGVKDKVILDKCRQDHGIWLDKGELERILDQAVMDEGDQVRKYLNEIFKQKREKGV